MHDGTPTHTDKAHAPIDSSHWKTSIDEEGRRSLMLSWLLPTVSGQSLYWGASLGVALQRSCVIVCTSSWAGNDERTMGWAAPVLDPKAPP